MFDTLNLKLEKLPLSKVPYFSSTFLDYLDKDPKLLDFIAAFPEPTGFDELIDNRNFPTENRSTLVSVLEEQYHGLVVSGKLTENIKALKQANCFTVTTGHQLNIFTGPLYFIYKIVSTIKITRVLKERFPDHEFVPVYWMASEDHDFAEINHFNLFGKHYQWNTDQQGAVGRFDPKGITDIIDELKECPGFFEKAYMKSATLADATREIVNHLFGENGLVVIDSDNHELKRLFSPVIKDELLQQTTFQKVTETSKTLQNFGYKTLVTPREINLFYLKGNLRERIVQEGQHYRVLSTDIKFSKEEMVEMVEDHPEYFSPNVVLRTLYQETILPNLAYVGGPGELSYWLQFKAGFSEHKIPFPVLFPRNNALVVNKTLTKKFAKLELEISDLFLHPDDLKSLFIEKNAKLSLELKSERAQTHKIFKELAEKVGQIDGSLSGYIKAEESKALKNLDQIQKRLKKAEERNQEMGVSQLMGLKEKLFPDGNLQERDQNFLNFYINDPPFIAALLEHLDPFDFRFHVLFQD